jgi:hypothetical protein
MGSLLTPEARRWPLRARTRLGRAADSDHPIALPSISRDHALLLWGGTAWELRDLGGQNGCFVRGTRLPPGGRATLEEGERFSLGTGLQLQLLDGSAPEPCARTEEGHWREGRQGLLTLEGDDGAEIWQESDGRWVMDGPEGQQPVADLERVDWGGQRWLLWLPGSEALDGTAPETPPPLPQRSLPLAGGLLRPEHRRFEREGRSLTLSPIEQRLLLHLVERSGQVQSHRDLLSEVWGYHQQVESRTVYVTLNRLRQKVEPDPSAPRHLLAVPGQGYLYQP